MTLWLARHAQPLIAAGVCYGQMDVPADATTTSYAAAALAAVLPSTLAVICSPLQRCEQLWQALHGLRPDLVQKTDPRLQEMHFGAWEGQPWADIDPDALKAWTDDFSNYPAGGHGETVDQLMVRVAAALDDLHATGASRNTLWITHAGVIRAATLIAQGQRHIDHAHQWPTGGPAFGQWVTLAL